MTIAPATVALQLVTEFATVDGSDRGRAMLHEFQIVVLLPDDGDANVQVASRLAGLVLAASEDGFEVHRILQERRKGIPHRGQGVEVA